MDRHAPLDAPLRMRAAQIATEAFETGLRMRLAFLCMAAVAGKEGDLKALTESIIEYVKASAAPGQ